MAQRWRVHHPDLPRRAGATVRLDPGESHHVSRVLRLGPGDRLDVFDGAGCEWSGVIEGGGPRELVVRLSSEIVEPVESPLEIVLCQSVCRPDRMDWVVQKATELGVAEIRAFSDPGRGRDCSARLPRWTRIAVESSKQCGRRRLPRIELADGLPAPPAEVLALLLDERPEAEPIGKRLVGTPPRAVWLGVGPEHGFSEADVARACEQGWRRAGLGPRTLRAETAGLVAASIVLHRWGDVGREDPGSGSPSPG